MGRSTWDARAAVVLVALMLMYTAAGATAQTETAPSAPPSAATDTELVFRLVDDPDISELGSGWIWNHSVGEGVIVALHECPDGLPSGACRPSILRSVDGLEWEIVGDRIDGSVHGITWSDAGFLFVLDDPDRKRLSVFHSADGRTWQRMPLRGTDYLEWVEAAPDGYLGYGCDRKCERPVAFWSADGQRWSRVTSTPDQTGPSQTITSGDATIGITEHDMRPEVDVFVSRDGRWVEVELPLPDAPTDGYVDIEDWTALPAGGFGIVGSVVRGAGGVEPFVLTSRDGVDWQRQPMTLDLGVERLRVEPFAILSGPGWLATYVILSGRGAKELGLMDADAFAWSGGDREWHVAPLPLPSGAEDAVLWGMLVSEQGRIVVIGETRQGRETQPAIWVGTFEEGPHARPSPSPTAAGDATATPLPERTPGWRQERADQEQELLAQAGYTSCSPFRARGDFDPFEFGATAAIQCERPAPGIGQVAVFRFPDPSSMDDYWSYRIDSLPASVRSSDSACEDGEAGHTTWAHGLVVCYLSSTSREAKVRWTDTRTNTYWLADADHEKVARLARWWRDERSSDPS